MSKASSGFLSHVICTTRVYIYMSEHRFPSEHLISSNDEFRGHMFDLF